MERSSSTIQMEGVSVMALLQRQVNRESGRAGLTVALDQPLMQADDVLCDGQAEAGAATAAADHGIENPLCDFRGYAGAVVVDVEATHQTVVAAADDDFALDAAAQQDAVGRVRRALQRLHGVAHDVQYHLHQLLPVALEQGDAGIVIALDGQLTAGLRFDERRDMLQYFVDVHRLQARWRVWPHGPV